MRPRLLHRDRDAALDQPPRPNAGALAQDLELRTLVETMAQGDRVVAGVARRVLLDRLTDVDAIAYRQDVLRDCLAHPDVPRALYALAVTTIERRKKAFWGLVRRPDAVVHNGIEILNLFQGAFRELRRIADANRDRLDSAGFGAFLAMIRRELDDSYLAETDAHLKALRFRSGVHVSARLGDGNKGTGYVLEPPAVGGRPARTRLTHWWRALLGHGPPVYTYRLPTADDSGVRALAELQARGLGRSASAIADACDDILAFFRQLRGEMAYYVGCLNLFDRLEAIGAPTCFPEPLDLQDGVRSASDLYDASLALTVGQRVVGNDVDADGADLIVITGANQGGKTTFLRSVGVAQLMMQCGMFVPARSFRSSVTTGVFTHFKRKEDARMRSGKLDEELARMNDIVAELAPGSSLLLNESFASTNEREGSEIAHQIVTALTEAGVRVLFVTHLSQFARGLFERRRPGTLFLRAERRPDGTRTFRMLEGAPTRTSHGEDLYHAIFGGRRDGPAARRRGAQEPEVSRGD